jgi:hypothetical protein
MVYLVDLVHLVYPVSLVQPNKQDKPNNTLLPLKVFFSIRLMRWRKDRDHAQRAAGSAGNFHRQGDHVKPPIRKIAEIT